MPQTKTQPRCTWAAGASVAMVRYHDEEWGVPSRDEHHLFELLTLEGAQAGLSWSTILNKREGYRRAFAGFDPKRVAAFDQHDVERLLADDALARGIVRHRGKIESTIANARCVLALHETGLSLSGWLWERVGGRPIQNRWRSPGDLPAETPLSRTISHELKRRGFRFVGPTTVYSFLQATGMVNDHLTSCFRHRPLARLGAAR